MHLVGARGPLTAAKSLAYLEHLSESSSQQTDIFSQHLQREERIAGSPLTLGNRVVLLQDGPATYEAMLQAIARAHDHINLETYILDADEQGQRFAKALLSKQRQGVQVNLIRDSVGTWGTPNEFFQSMAVEGVRVLEFNPVNPLATHMPWRPNQRDHRKLLIVDGQTAFLGGINISSVYSGGSARSSTSAPNGPDLWRDTDLELTGPVVGELQKLFLATWNDQHASPLAQRDYFPALPAVGVDVVRALGSEPDEVTGQMYATLLSAINSAQTTIHLTNAYFAPEAEVLQALAQAAQRQVEVILVLPSKADSWLVMQAGRSHYADLLRAGVKIYERQGVILHSKTVLIDGVWAAVGSTNLDWRSVLHNREVNAVVLGGPFGAQVQVMFDQDQTHSIAVSLPQWQQRPWQQRLGQWFAQLWEYWL